jgi:mannose-1-phosphate guanylyltransferase/mannose-6-phosphate isomerase
MIQDTVLRLPEAEPPILICNEEHRFLVAEQMHEIGIVPRAIVLEPLGRNTAPAAITASLLVAEIDPDGIVLLLPSDHIVPRVAEFHDAIAKAVRAAESGFLVTFGITPSAPHTGYGYISRGDAIGDVPGSFKVERFVEKPDLEIAKSYLQTGGYFWNSGMFVFRARTFLEETDRIDRSLNPPVEAALAHAQRDADFIRLDRAAFEAAKSISIDNAVMEHTKRAAVVPADIGWNDIGSWLALWEVGEPDARGNVVRGDVVLHDTAQCLVRTEGALVAVVGLEDVIVVATEDAVLVASRSRTQDVKAVVERLKREGRGEF